MRIYTKTGDAGETGLFDGTRVSKADPRVDAYGEVDELNAWLGVARAHGVPPEIGDMLVQIQRDLFALGARLADPRHKIAARVEKATLGDADIIRLEQAIDRLENNFETGDTVVDIVGFSRGAALAVSFANELAGKFPRVIVRFMGLWDMVGHFGAPGKRFNAGHDLGMPPNVMRCYHAMALDETRLDFSHTRLSETDPDNGRLLEVWFRGMHTDVGGGNGRR